LVVASLFVFLVVAATLAGRLPQAVILTYGVVSILTFLVYWYDKSAARNGQWRTKEKLAALPRPRGRMARGGRRPETATPQVRKADFSGGILGNRRDELDRSRMASHGQRIEAVRTIAEMITYRWRLMTRCCLSPAL